MSSKLTVSVTQTSASVVARGDREVFGFESNFYGQLVGVTGLTSSLWSAGRGDRIDLLFMVSW